MTECGGMTETISSMTNPGEIFFCTLYILATRNILLAIQTFQY